MHILLTIICILAMVVIAVLLKLLIDNDKIIKKIQSKEKILDYKLSKIAEMRQKAEKNIHHKMQQNEAQIALEQEKLKVAIKKVDDFILAKKQAFEEELTLKKEKLDLYEQSIKQQLKTVQEAQYAIERVIDGYGDEYIIPHIQLVDELAENYSLEHAGNKLKECRAIMRAMIKQGTATKGNNLAQCKMLLDYFSTKSEELIAKVKHENYGKLKEELKDVYAICHYYAQQSQLLASITDEFYALCQEELKWASIVHTMRIAEREEQREIRERMREEERAKREYERAIKEAQKEEAMLQKAMEKARAAYASANAEQKAKYEQQLNDLESRLKEAEEKNQRALSMAQQTRSGNVYLISNIGSFGENMVKIGMTRRLEPMDRVRELGDASVPFQFDVHAIIYSDDAPKLEKDLHRAFKDQRVNKVNHRKEFFRVSVQDVKAKLEELGIKAQFTLAAEAAEYRETLRIEAMDSGMKDRLFDTLLEQEVESEND